MNHEIDPSQKGQPTPEQIGARRLPLQEQIGKKVGEIRARVKNTLGLRSRDLSPQEQADRRKILQTGVALGVGGALFGASIFEQPSAHADPQPPITPEGVPTPEPGEAGEGEPSLNAPSSSEPAPIPATPGPEKPKTAAEVSPIKEADIELIPNEDLVERLRLSSEDETEWKKNKPWVIKTFVKAGQLFGSEGVIQQTVKLLKPSTDGRIRAPYGRVYAQYFPENSPLTSPFAQRFNMGFGEPAIVQWVYQNPERDMVVPTITIFGAAIKEYIKDPTNIRPLVDTDIAFATADIIHRHQMAIYSKDMSAITEGWLGQAVRDAESKGIKNDYEKRRQFYMEDQTFGVYMLGQALWNTSGRLIGNPEVQKNIADGSYKLDSFTRRMINTRAASVDAISFIKNLRDNGIIGKFQDNILTYGSQFG